MFTLFSIQLTSTFLIARLRASRRGAINSGKNVTAKNYSDFLEFSEPEDLTNFYFYKQALSDQQIGVVEKLSESLKDERGTAGGETNDSYRSSRIRWIHYGNDSHWLYETLGTMAATANRALWNFNIAAMTESIQFGEYHATENGHYDWHLDIGAGSFKRKISIVVQLTDPAEYEGGDLELLFGRSPQRVERGKGNVTVFPSYVLHRVTPVTKGIRRSLVIWVSGEPFR
ncbi:hypothetical protein AB833_24730 [Chromatiales bacterium (ex Bugula neritina AB1)]|nr:hypothetical protein AB833_24730 [Chromatiales bacterium (ex Bugula neritina AB1)]